MTQQFNGEVLALGPAALRLVRSQSRGQWIQFHQHQKQYIANANIQDDIRVIEHVGSSYGCNTFLVDVVWRPSWWGSSPYLTLAQSPPQASSFSHSCCAYQASPTSTSCQLYHCHIGLQRIALRFTSRIMAAEVSQDVSMASSPPAVPDGQPMYAGYSRFEIELEVSQSRRCSPACIATSLDKN